MLTDGRSPRVALHPLVLASRPRGLVSGQARIARSAGLR
jgi:hypothetical protein